MASPTRSEGCPLDAAHKLYARAEDMSRVSLPAAERKRLYVESSKLYLQAAEHLSRDKIAQMALVYLAAQAIQRKDMLDIITGASSQGTDSAPNRASTDRAGGEIVAIPSSLNGRIATAESMERVTGLSAIAKATNSSDDVINDLVCLEQQLADIDYVRPLAPTSAKGSSSLAHDGQRREEATMADHAGGRVVVTPMPTNPNPNPQPRNAPWLMGWPRQIDPSPLAFPAKTGVSSSRSMQPATTTAAQVFSDISRSQLLCRREQRADDPLAAGLAPPLPAPSPGDGESVLRLLAAVQRLSAENASLERRLDAYAQVQARERELRKEMDAFRAEYALKFAKVKKVLGDFVAEYPGANNPARTYISATTSSSSSSSSSKDTQELKNAALRQRQLEAAVEALVKRLEQATHEARQRDKLVKKYEPYYRAAKATMNRGGGEQLPSAPPPAPPHRPLPSQAAARSTHTSTLAALLREQKREV